MATLDSQLECPLQTLSDHILNHVTETSLTETLRKDKTKKTHDPQKTAEAIEIISELGEKENSLDRIKEIGLRWTDKQGREILDAQGKKFPQAIFLVVELASGDKMICIVGPDLDNISHGTVYKWHKTDLARDKITHINQDTDPEEFKKYANLAKYYLKESVTAHGTPFHREAGQPQSPIICPAESLCPTKKCQTLIPQP